MHRLQILAIIVMAATLMLSGCVWVKLTPDGEEVLVLEQVESGCELRGRTTAISRAKVAGVKRDEKKFLTELQTIARNQAATMDGNVVVADGMILDDQLTFVVYRCP